MEAILDILRSTRLTGGVFLEADFSAPWCIRAQVDPEDCRPFTRVPRNIVAYHYVADGRFSLALDGEAPVEVERGEIVVLPQNRPHTMGSTLEIPPVLPASLIQPGADGGLARLVLGGGGERTRVLCGFLGNDTPDDPALAILPPVLKVNVADGAAAAWIESSLKFAAAELAGGVVRSPELLAKLAELLFLEAVRRYVTALPSDPRWREGLRDPMVGRALALLHGRMSQRWTAGALAREVGLSRSALAERFTKLLGEPPIRYLARLRLQQAARRLEASADSIARIAFQVGYESEAAFNRAFKREFGEPPAAWRKRRAECREAG